MALSGVKMLARLRNAGLVVTVKPAPEGDGLDVYPAGAITPEMRSAIREYKAQILSALHGEREQQKPAKAALRAVRPPRERALGEHDLIVAPITVPFTTIPNDLFDWPEERDLSLAASALLFQLARFSFGYKGHSQEIRREVWAKRCNLSLRTIVVAMNELDEKGCIRREPRTDALGHRMASMVRINWQPPEESLRAESASRAPHPKVQNLHVGP